MTAEFSRRPVLAGIASAFALTAAPAFSQDATREVLEMSLGADDAPVTVIEYASFTCPHCQRFHLDVFPKIKENYIDTGKVKFVLREVYFDKYGLWAGMIARCSGPDRYFGLTDVLFHKQDEWAHAADEASMVEQLYAIGRQAGMTNEEMEACVQDGDFAQALVERYQETATADDVTGTPSFMVNGEKVKNMPYDEFSAKLDDALGS